MPEDFGYAGRGKLRGTQLGFILPRNARNAESGIFNNAKLIAFPAATTDSSRQIAAAALARMTLLAITSCSPLSVVARRADYCRPVSSALPSITDTERGA
jgi:hypothetical protein